MTASKPKKMDKDPNPTERNPFSITWPNKGGDKLVGGYLPRRDADYLNLLALYRGTTMSDIFREAVEKIRDDSEPEDHLIQVLATRAGTEWASRLESNQGNSGWLTKADVYARYREYEQEMRLLLLKRNIAENMIRRIVKRMETLYGGM